MDPLTPSHRLGSINDLLLYRLGRLSAIAGAMVVRLCEGGYGITRREWGVIGHLQQQGPLAPSELAERFQIDRARASRMVSSLVEKGLISRQEQPGNRRQAMLVITPQGVALFEELMPQVQAINRRVLQVLEPQEMAQLDDFISRLHGSAQEASAELDAQLPKAQRRLGQRRG